MFLRFILSFFLSPFFISPPRFLYYSPSSSLFFLLATSMYAVFVAKLFSISFFFIAKFKITVITTYLALYWAFVMSLCSDFCDKLKKGR